MQNLMEKIIKVVIAIQTNTSNKIVIKDYNLKCLNDSVSHVCFAGGSPCCNNFCKTHFCTKENSDCKY